MLFVVGINVPVAGHNWHNTQKETYNFATCPANSEGHEFYKNWLQTLMALQGHIPVGSEFLQCLRQTQKQFNMTI